MPLTNFFIFVFTFSSKTFDAILGNSLPLFLFTIGRILIHPEGRMEVNLVLGQFLLVNSFSVYTIALIYT